LSNCSDVGVSNIDKFPWFSGLLQLINSIDNNSSFFIFN